MIFNPEPPAAQVCGNRLIADKTSFMQAGSTILHSSAEMQCRTRIIMGFADACLRAELSLAVSRGTSC